MTDVAIIGAGIVGLSTARALRERGERPDVYERATPGAGQSGGDSRIFRHAHDDRRMMRFAQRSREIWAEWEERLGTELVSGDGAVALGVTALERLELARQVPDVPLRELRPRELGEWLPVLVDYDGPAIVDEGGGATRNRAAVEMLTEELGSGLTNDEVLGVRVTDGGTVELRAGGGTVEYERLIVCAGRSTVALARGVGIEIPVDLSVHVRLTFAVRGNVPPRLACLQDSSGEFGETGIYAATSPGGGAYGVGLSETVAAGADGALPDVRMLAEHAERVRAYVRRALPGLDPDPIDVRHCWVTELPWGEDGIGIWEQGPVLAVAGHNMFKNAPALGRALAAAAVGDGLDDELRPEAKLGEPE